MTNPIGRFHDIETGEVIDRELTDAELKELTEPKAEITPSGNQVEHLTEIVSGE